MGQIALAVALLVYAGVRLAFDGFNWIRALMLASAIAWIWTAINNWRAKRDAESDEAKVADPAPSAAAPSPIFTREHAAVLRETMEFNRVARQPPPEVSEADIRATARPAIFLRRASLPVPLDHPARSYFGGLPRMPTELAWPEQSEHALTFLAQIDLAELPAIDASPLPRTGTLYFFSNTNSECPEADDCRVLYYAGDASSAPLRELPANTQRYGIGDELWPWLPDDSLWTQTNFRLPIEFVPFESFSGWIHRSHGLPPQTAERLDDVIAAERVRLFGPDEAPDREPWQALERDTEEWPFAWIAIELGARSIVHAVDEAMKQAEAQSVADDYKRMRETASRWIERVKAEVSHSPVDDESRIEFLGEWRTLVADYRRISNTVKIYGRDPLRDLSNVVMAACYVCAANGASQLIPETYRSALERWNDAHRTFPQHQMLGYGELVQAAAYERMDEVLLLQLKGDIGLGWHTNTGCALQFWIRPEQLTETAFQTVELTLECD